MKTLIMNNAVVLEPEAWGNELETIWPRIALCNKVKLRTQVVGVTVWHAHWSINHQQIKGNK